MSEHYYSKKQTSPFKLSTIIVRLRDEEFEFDTAPGVFSKNRIDNGTKLLINEVIVKPNDKVLDLGCGYGPVGIAVAKTCDDCTVVMIDINQRAVKLAKINARKNKVKVKVKQGNVFERVESSKFNLILLNPPQTAGKKLCNQMILESKDHLVKNGSLWLVGRHRIGGREFEKKMKEVFDNVETIARKSGFRIYRSTNQD